MSTKNRLSNFYKELKISVIDFVLQPVVTNDLIGIGAKLAATCSADEFPVEVLHYDNKSKIMKPFPIKGGDRIIEDFGSDETGSDRPLMSKNKVSMQFQSLEESRFLSKAYDRYLRHQRLG